MKRKTWLKQAGIAAGSLIGAPAFLRKRTSPHREPVLKIAHLTDVHIRPENDVPERFKKCLNDLFTHNFDFILNGGDTIHAADYDDITRKRVLEQWDAWGQCAALFENKPVYSCLGNHDMWWAAPDKQDEMYGKNYVTKRLKMPGRYYSFTEKGWTFIILDGNNPGVSVDDEQVNWLEKKLESLSDNSPVLIMSHYPILTVTGHFYPNDQHSDADKLSRLFYRHQDKVKCCISGHMHLLDEAIYNGTTYYCNGAVSGFWWGDGNERSADRGYYRETPPGYAILSLYENGQTKREYIEHDF